jgi:hypothetical protein
MFDLSSIKPRSTHVVLSELSVWGWGYVSPAPMVINIPVGGGRVEHRGSSGIGPDTGKPHDALPIIARTGQAPVDPAMYTLKNRDGNLSWSAAYFTAFVSLGANYAKLQWSAVGLANSGTTSLSGNLGSSAYWPGVVGAETAGAIKILDDNNRLFFGNFIASGSFHWRFGRK